MDINSIFFSNKWTVSKPYVSSRLENKKLFNFRFDIQKLFFFPTFIFSLIRKLCYSNTPSNIITNVAFRSCFSRDSVNVTVKTLYTRSIFKVILLFLAL